MKEDVYTEITDILYNMYKDEKDPVVSKLDIIHATVYYYNRHVFCPDDTIVYYDYLLKQNRHRFKFKNGRVEYLKLGIEPREIVEKILEKGGIIYE